VRTDAPIPDPPFLGTKVVDDIPLDDVFRFVNEVALVRGQWQMRKGKMKEEEYRKLLDEKILPDFSALKQQIKREGLLQPRAAYGYFPCQSQGDDLIIYREDQRQRRGSRFPADG
jgi:5-methyltetrahydrofolate--homocysteine methyltransferase